jgi:hypothetical protein
MLTLLMSASASAALRFSFAFTPSLRTFVMPTPPRLRQDASLLHLAFETFERNLKRITWIHQNFCHEVYQRDRPDERPLLCAW